MAITAKDLQTKPLTRLLAPKSLKEMVLLPRVYDLIKDGIHNNFLFYGPPGLGKSTLARVISDNHTMLYVNASLDGNMENLRTRLTEFATENSIVFDKSPVKVIYMDEFDGASPNFYDAFRGFTEQFQNVFFIATANKFHKLAKHEYILSRFECVNMAPTSGEEKELLYGKYTSRFKLVSKQLGITYTGDDVIDYVCKHKFPDFRGIYKFIQRIYKTTPKGTAVDMTMVAGAIYEFSELYKLILNPDTQPEKFHEHLLINYADRSQEVIEALDVPFVHYVVEKAPEYVNILGDVVIQNAEHQHKFFTCLDQTTVMKSLCFVINKMIKTQSIKVKA